MNVTCFILYFFSYFFSTLLKCCFLNVLYKYIYVTFYFEVLLLVKCHSQDFNELFLSWASSNLG